MPRVEQARGYFARAASIQPDHPDLGRVSEALERANAAAGG